MKLIQLNLHKLMDEKQLKFMAEQKADIYCLQEVVVPSGFVNLFPLNYLFAKNYGKTGTTLNSNYMLQEPVTITTRETLWMKKNIIGATINGVRVYTLHGYNGAPWRTFSPWKEQMDLLFAEVDKWPTSMPMVIAGDFNTFSDRQKIHLMNNTDTRKFAGARFLNDNKKDLDWVFWRNVKDTGLKKVDGLSDHPAIVFEFEV